MRGRVRIFRIGPENQGKRMFMILRRISIMLLIIIMILWKNGQAHFYDNSPHYLDHAPFFIFMRCSIVIMRSINFRPNEPGNRRNRMLLSLEPS